MTISFPCFLCAQNKQYHETLSCFFAQSFRMVCAKWISSNTCSCSRLLLRFFSILASLSKAAFKYNFTPRCLSQPLKLRILRQVVLVSHFMQSSYNSQPPRGKLITHHRNKLDPLHVHNFCGTLSWKQPAKIRFMQLQSWKLHLQYPQPSLRLSCRN